MVKVSVDQFGHCQFLGSLGSFLNFFLPLSLYHLYCLAWAWIERTKCLLHLIQTLWIRWLSRSHTVDGNQYYKLMRKVLRFSVGIFPYCKMGDWSFHNLLQLGPCHNANESGKWWIRNGNIWMPLFLQTQWWIMVGLTCFQFDIKFLMMVPIDLFPFWNLVLAPLITWELDAETNWDANIDRESSIKKHPRKTCTIVLP